MKPCPICQYDGVIVRGWPEGPFRPTCDICKWEGEAEWTPAEAEQSWTEEEEDL